MLAKLGFIMIIHGIQWDIPNQQSEIRVSLKWGIPLSSSHQIRGINGDYPMDEVPYSQTNPLVGKCLYCSGDLKHHLKNYLLEIKTTPFYWCDVQVGHLP